VAVEIRLQGSSLGVTAATTHVADDTPDDRLVLYRLMIFTAEVNV
jgi:hypothetical protein